MNRQAGFTLLEVLIALTIFAVAAGGLLVAGGNALRQTQALERRTLALVVAENKLAELRAARVWPEVGVSSAQVPMAQREWLVKVTVMQTPNADMRQYRVEVAEGAGRVVVGLTGFMGRY